MCAYLVNIIFLMIIMGNVYLSEHQKMRVRDRIQGSSLHVAGLVAIRQCSKSNQIKPNQTKPTKISKGEN